ncbi:MAG: hypothetical protein WEB59_15295 [Thermoanaerobaculia bacterium]
MILLSVAILLALPFSDGGMAPKVIGLLLVTLLSAQSFILGALPRYALPLLPAVLLFASAGLAQPWRVGRRVAAAAVFLALLIATVSHGYVLDREWGVIERAGLRIEQTIPRGALPDRLPATLHVRIGRPLLPSQAELDVFGPGGRRIYATAEERLDDGPLLTIPLPGWIIEENRRSAVPITVVSAGIYDRLHFWLFPVIPRPWAAPARRADSEELSPATGIASGSLDWWAHEGTP